MATNSGCIPACRTPVPLDYCNLVADCAPCRNDLTPIARYDSEYEKLCDEISPGVIVPYFALFQHDDEIAGSVAPTFVDGSGNPYTPVNPVVCPANEGAKLHVVEHCWQDASDCNVFYKQIICLDLDTSSIVSSMWIDAGAVVIPAPAGVIPCDSSLGPYVANAHGIAAPMFEPFNSFAIHKPDCCELTIATDAGTLTMPQGQTHYSSDTFKCLLTNISVSGECVSDTTIFVNRTM